MRPSDYPFRLIGFTNMSEAIDYFNLNDYTDAYLANVEKVLKEYDVVPSDIRMVLNVIQGLAVTPVVWRSEPIKYKRV